MKKLLAVVLLLMLVMSFAGCGVSEPTPETETAVQESTQLVFDDSSIVSEADYIELEDPFGGFLCYYHIPRINLEDDKASGVNEQIMAQAEEFMQDAYLCIDQDVSITNAGFNYLWGYNKGVVSVTTAQYYGHPGLSFEVYNVSDKTGELIMDEELAQLYGYTYDQMLSLISEKSGECFDDYYTQAPKDDFYDLQYTQTIGVSNAKLAKLFINDQGDLCCVAKIYSLAGADSYYRLINLTGDTEVPEPDMCHNFE